MIISKIYNKLNSEQKGDFIEGLVWGLVSGLIWGLIMGLAFGLVVGLIVGLVFGIVFGIIFGLVVMLVFGFVWGLMWGLTFGLTIILTNFSEALPFISGFSEIFLIIIGIIVISEILFWLMHKEKIKKKNIFWHTCKTKAECLFEVLLGLSLITIIYILIRETSKYFNQRLLEFSLRLIGYTGLGIVGLGVIGLVFYIWIKLNSLKYSHKG